MVVTPGLCPAAGSPKIPWEWAVIGNGGQYVASSTVLKGPGLPWEVIAVGSPQAQSFLHNKFKGASNESSLSPATPTAQSHAAFFFGGNMLATH